MCAAGGMNGAIYGDSIKVIPSLTMNVLQTLLTDSYLEYISAIPVEIKTLLDKNN